MIGSPVNVQFMVKDSKKYAATGGWGFADFKDGKPGDKALHETCFPCHTPAKDRDYVFTRYAPLTTRTKNLLIESRLRRTYAASRRNGTAAQVAHLSYQLRTRRAWSVFHRLGSFSPSSSSKWTLPACVFSRSQVPSSCCLDRSR